jgi:hypothetical protein
MARLARFLMGDGRIDGQPFVDPALLAAMGRPAGTEAARAGLAVGYGLGMATRDRHAAAGKCHGGNTVGYRAMFCLTASRTLATVRSPRRMKDWARVPLRLWDVKRPAAAPSEGAGPRRAWETGRHSASSRGLNVRV